MSLVRRSVTSSIYNVTANVISLVIGFGGSIALARLLEPETFGVFAFVTSVVQLTVVLPNFGFHSAFLHRTRGEKGVTEEILRVSFTLKLLFSLVWAALLAVGVALFAPEHTRWVFWIMLAISFVGLQMSTINTLLTRQVQFRRLALAQAASAVATTLVAVGLAWCGWGVWALLCGNMAATLIWVMLLGVIRPVWRPRLGWSKELARYFIGFGSKVFGTALLLEALDRVDDIWTGVALGDKALGFYDKAYGYATYPRHVLMLPLVQVVIGTYTELLDDRPRLSRTFAWVNMLMARANFWIAALLWLVAPEVIRLVLGDRWLPMLDAFRLMLVYTMFDPIKNMISSLLILSGAPERVIRARIIQLAVMVAGLVTLGPGLGIAGVALAVDAMLVVGMIILYAEARRLVDFSLRKLFCVPALAMGLGLLAVYGALTLANGAGNDWLSGVVKAVVFSLVYAGILLLVEREELLQTLRVLLKAMRPQPSTLNKNIE
jgi:O-antigen/teichoic acid export membrane protein